MSDTEDTKPVVPQPANDGWDIPINWRERSVDPSSFAFITGRPFETPQEVEEKALIRTARQLVWQLLLKRVDELAEIFLTSHQKRVFDLWIKQGNTYQEIGALLSKLNGYSCDYSAYTAISHCIKGIRSNKHGGKYHGGIENRLRKRCEKDAHFLLLLEDWKSLQQDKLTISLDFLSQHDDWYQQHRTQIEQHINSLKAAIKPQDSSIAFLKNETSTEVNSRLFDKGTISRSCFDSLPRPQSPYGEICRNRLIDALVTKNFGMIHQLMQQAATMIHPKDRENACYLVLKHGIQAYKDLGVDIEALIKVK